MEIFTNGVFPATRHRVVVPAEEALLKKHRQTFAYFVHSDDEVVAEPIHGEEPSKDKYRPIKSRTHLVQKFMLSFSEKDFVPS